VNKVLAENYPSPLRTHLVLLTVFIAVLAWSAVRPFDRFTWFLEVVPAVAGAVILAATYRRFRFTTLVYVLILIHAIILCVGGHYTYARVPLGDWVRDALNLDRNHYDRLGHFVQGFVPAMIAREVLVRASPLKPGRWLFFLVVCFCLALSASYELIEWAVAAMTGTAAEEFLGTQGDVWDTQKDMGLALVGALAALLALSKIHDRAIARLKD
jgi:putative membrane protein